MATPPDFTAGQVLTAAQMNAVGMWRVTGLSATFTGGTAGSVSDGVVTIGTTNTAVIVTNAFSADYENYLIVIAGGVGSTSAELRLTFNAGTQTNNYFHGGNVYVYGSAASTFETANGVTTGIRIGEIQATGYSVNATVYAPFLSTTITTVNSDCSGRLIASNRGGAYNQTVSNTGFTITAATGSMTGGKIRVYGYRL